MRFPKGLGKHIITLIVQKGKIVMGNIYQQSSPFSSELQVNTCSFKSLYFTSNYNPFKLTYKKKDAGTPSGEGKSPSEKSFVALNGYGTQTSELINDLGVAYAPTNTFIEAAAFGTFVNDMIARAKSVAKLEGIYSDAVKVRYEIYHGKDGLLERQATIKEYLASFPEGKNSQSYIEFDRLIKGN